MDHHQVNANEGQCSASAAPSPTPSQPQHRLHRSIETTDDHHGSHTSEKLLQHQPPPPPSSSTRPRSLDPTGMFRNRGRRVIASASAAATTTTSTTTERSNMSTSDGMQKILQRNINARIITSSLQSTSPSPTKTTNIQHHHSYQSSSIISQSGEEMLHPKQHEQQEQQQQQQQHRRFDGLLPRDEISFASTSRSKGIIVDEDDEGRMSSHEKDTSGYSPSPLQPASPTNTQTIESETGLDYSGVENDNDDKEEEEDERSRRTTSYKSNVLLHRSHGHDTNNAIEDDEEEEEEEENHLSPSSDIGSTVSIMGSIIGDNNMGGYDNARLLAVRRRMMHDVEEIPEEGATTCEINNESLCGNHNYEEVIGSRLESPSELLNVSLECNADTDTSLLEDYPSNHNNSCPDEKRDSTWRDDRNSEISAEILDSKQNDAVSVNSSNNRNSDNWGSGSGTGTGTDNNNANETQTRKEQESPFRAAFRRSAQGMSNRLPPMSTQLLSERLTHNRFQLASASSAIDKAATTASLIPQFARQCFSFEDTTIDDDTFFVMPEHVNAGGELSSGYNQHQQTTTHKYYGLSGVASFATIDEGGNTSTVNQLSSKRNPPIVHPSQQTGSSSAGDPDSPFRIIRHAQTWNHHGQSPTGEITKSRRGRNESITHLNGTIQLASSFDPWTPKSGRRNSSELVRDEEPIAIHRAEHNQAVSQASEARDWKKIETERGDALDILAFMVELSLKAAPFDTGSSVLLCNKCQHDREVNSSVQNCCSECFAKLKRIAKTENETGEKSSSSDRDVLDIDQQMKSDAIDALLRSFEFALEVKRSSLSAKKWLNSIGWITEGVDNNNIDDILALDDIPLRARLRSAELSLSNKEGDLVRLNEELSKCRAEIGRLKSSHGAQMLRQPIPLVKNKSILSESSSDSSSDSDSIDNISKETAPLVLCPSRPTSVKLSDSQDESFTKWEKNIEAQMNLESRKEILLLKAALEKAQRTIKENQTVEPFSSEIEPINTSSDDGDTFMEIAEDRDNKSLDVGRDIVASEVPTEIRLNDPALEKELEEYRLALLATLEHRTSSDDPQIDRDVSKSTSSEHTSDRKMINVRMIDGENFSTEWGDLIDLPPPPDHDLRSPIVEAILNKWSEDRDTQLSLIQWMEHILSGASIDTIPSLKLSGLDHQLRDGFVMHVLPLLLRRKDVHVHFTSRAHRQTTYDIAVSVTPTAISVQSNKHDAVSDSGSEDAEFRKRQLSRESKHHLMAFHATKSGASIREDANVHRSPMPFWSRTIPGLTRTPSNAGSISTAVTTPISNRTPSRGPHNIPGKSRFTSLLSDNMKKDDNSMPVMMSVTSPSLGDDLSVGSSVDTDSDNRDREGQSRIMGSISGAFGLLTRRKPSPVEKGFQGASPSPLHTPARKIVSNDDEHPYHRVVSAPPGKIGISFVEYRGHAMVSNVSDDSPLVGWVFPSDVLVAIDDVSVSGLPTREIVKLLTSRVHQQRNLRMISAVAMNERSRPGTV